MRTRFIILCLLWTLPLLVFAQKHDYIRICGYDSFSGDPRFGGLKINFNTIPPSLDKFSTKLNFSFFGVTCSDSSGSLLFYSNGIRIYNKADQLMENGDTINPGKTWLDKQNPGYITLFGGLTIPAPGQTNCYYMFHMAWIYEPPLIGDRPLYYTFIDMNANGGLGKVVQKNVPLNDTDFILTPIAVKHGNGRDWWLITGKSNTTIQYVYLISPEGISGPLVQQFGLATSVLEGGYAMASPDGNTYLRSQLDDTIRIYDFNRCTGELSHQRLIPRNGKKVSVGFFSADSRMLYVLGSRSLCQIDMNYLDSANVAQSAYMDTLAYRDNYADPAPPFYADLGFPQHAPDGKIYLNNLASTQNQHIIHRPELPGAACDIQLHGLVLPRVNDVTTYNYPYYRLGAWEGSPCDTLGSERPGFAPTRYEAARWEQPGWKNARVVQVFPPGPPVSAEEWANDPLLLTNAARRAIERRREEPVKQEAKSSKKEGHE